MNESRKLDVVIVSQHPSKATTNPMVCKNYSVKVGQWLQAYNCFKMVQVAALHNQT
jgi:hypothetical protein